MERDRFARLFNPHTTTYETSRSLILSVCIARSENLAIIVRAVNVAVHTLHFCCRLRLVELLRQLLVLRRCLPRNVLMSGDQHCL